MCEAWKSLIWTMRKRYRNVFSFRFLNLVLLMLSRDTYHLLPQLCLCPGNNHHLILSIYLIIYLFCLTILLLLLMSLFIYLFIYLLTDSFIWLSAFCLPINFYRLIFSYKLILAVQYFSSLIQFICQC